MHESKIRLLQLSFEDFLEAIVRLATMKTLPDDETVYEADCEDAGEMLIKLRTNDPMAYNSFLRNPDFAAPYGAPLKQPIFKLVEHVCILIMRTVASVVASAGDERKSVKDMDAMTEENVKLFKTLCRRKNDKKG